MSQNDDDAPLAEEGDLDLDFEWDDALAEWEDELEEKAEAESAPMPQTARSRDEQVVPPLYRPPSPDEQFARRAPRPPIPPPARPSLAKDDFIPLGSDEDDDEFESTRIARIPKELIDSLVNKEERGNDLPTRPPPPPESSTSESVRPPPVALDLDGLLEGMEGETRTYAESAELNATAPKATTVPDESTVAPIGGAAEMAGSAPTPFEDEDDDIVASFPSTAPPRPADRELKAAPPPIPPPARLPSPPASAERRVPPPIPRVPRPPAPPSPGARPNVPRPALPAIPRPGQRRAEIPKPPRPAVPRPPLPSIPRPGASVPPRTEAPPQKPEPPLEPKLEERSIPKAPPAPSSRAGEKLETRLDEMRPVSQVPEGTSPPATPSAKKESGALSEEEKQPSSKANDARAPEEAKALGPEAIENAPEAIEKSSEVTESAPEPVDTVSEGSEPALEAADGHSQPVDAVSEESGPALEAADGHSQPVDAVSEESEPALEATSSEQPGAEAAPEAAETDLDAPEDERAEQGAEPEPADEPRAAEAAPDQEALFVAEAKKPSDEETALVQPSDGTIDSSETDGEEEEEEALIVQADESDGEEFEDEDWEALEAAADAEAKAVEEDRGALAARRTVRSRKLREEVFPMVGHGPDALRLRKRLLETLAADRQGAVCARLLVGAAELAEQLGELDDARSLYLRALEADPTDVVALRALRRDATSREAWSDVAELLAKEAELELTAQERALALNALAELHLGRLADPSAAERAAARAVELAPSSLASHLLLAEARFAQGRVDEALSALTPLAEHWNDPKAQAAILALQAQHAERKGERDEARELHRRASELDADALDAHFGLARTSTTDEPKTAIDALEAIASRLSEPVAEPFLTRASRIATLLLDDPKRGMALLENGTSVAALQARAQAALASGDSKAAVDALGAWASAAGGTDRALALVRLAETLANAGDLDGAEAALRDAALADGSLGTIRVVRQVIARRAGDVSRLVDAMTSGGALDSAARIASSPDALEREQELLATAAEEGEALVAVDVLALDVAAELGDTEALDSALRRQAERVAPEQRVGSLLARAEQAALRGDLDAAEAVLTEARTLSPGDPLVLRPLGRLAMRRDAKAAAALWMEEASVATGERAAYAATEAARVLARADGDALGALRRALDAARGYRPAAGLLKPLATELGDPRTLLEAHEQLAETAAHPSDTAGHLVRAALLRAHDDPEGAGALLERARALVPSDAVLVSLLMRLSVTGAPAERAAMLAEVAESAPPVLARVFRLQAAALFEDAGQPQRAAAEYRAVAALDRGDPIVSIGLDRAEIAAGEVARVAERRFQAVKEATSDEERVLALERLADLDLYERQDPASAVLSLSSILETAPGHLPSLRALQRYFAQQGRREEELEVLDRMAAHLEAGVDVTSHLRLARRLLLAPPDAPGDSADALLVRHAERAELDLWLAPRLLAAAGSRRNDAVAATSAKRLAELLATASERASARIRAAELLTPHNPEAALELLREALQSAPQHPLAAEALAEACEQKERWEEAAEAWEAAAKSSEVRSRAAALAYRAGRLWEEKLENQERARRAYEYAAERDIAHADLFERLRRLLEAAGARERLAELFGQRVAAGGDTPTLVELYIQQAALFTELSEIASAKAALRAALALMPERLDALRSLANLCLEDEDWRGAAEVLIRIARIRKEREELRWVFFTLGDIYDRHMPDARRAEAAFQRVLKLLPEDVPAMERLAELFERQGEHAKAAEMLTKLAQLDVDPERNRAHRLKLAEMHEQLSDARRAEQVLEEARKNAPTDLAVLRALADFYRRQGADNALSMHLGRAVNDFRYALDADLGDAAAWPGLVEVLTWRGDRDAASAAASAAQALGIVDIETSKLVDARGAAPGLFKGAALDSLDELLAPASLPAATREVFRLAGDALEKSLPFDVAAYRAEKLPPRDTSIRPLALDVARAFGVDDPQLYVTSAAPRVCVPVYSNPVSILVGSELLGITDDREKLFVLVRAFKIAHAQLSVVMRAQPAELLALMGGLVTLYDPRRVVPGADPALVSEASRRIQKNLQRKTQSELGPLVFEMAGRPDFDPARFPMAASEWGNRTALVASGSAPAAIAALAKLSGERELPADPNARLAMIQRFPEAASLLAFAISEAHFEARKRAAAQR